MLVYIIFRNFAKIMFFQLFVFVLPLHLSSELMAFSSGVADVRLVIFAYSYIETHVVKS